MQSKLLLIFLFIFFPVHASAQNLTQELFTAQLIPVSMGSGTSTRLPVVFRATVEGLTPSTQYRFFIQAARFTDLGGTNPGAGNPLLINPDSANYVYSTGPSLTSSGNYSVFMTNASGTFTGWFAFVNTGNARFTAGNYIIPTISIGDNTGTLVARRALNDSILVMEYGTAAAATTGTGFWGRSNGTPTNLVVIFNNTTGTGKPLAVTYIENEGVTVASTIPFYTDSVNGYNGRWGAIIPNVNSNGVRRVEQRSKADGSIIAFNVSMDGTWPSGANTVNPSGGTTPIVLDSLDAPLPVELVSFSYFAVGGKVHLNWRTASEINNYGFEIEKSDDASTFNKIGFIAGIGSSNTFTDYEFIDGSTAEGKYYYQLKQIDFDGTFEYSNVLEVNLNSQVKFSLDQNYPNPFNPSTKISFQLPVKSRVSLKVYNLIGKEVAVLIDEERPVGAHQFDFDASTMPSGLYIYTLKTDSYKASKKMILIK